MVATLVPGGSAVDGTPSRPKVRQIAMTSKRARPKCQTEMFDGARFCALRRSDGGAELAADIFTTDLKRRTTPLAGQPSRKNDQDSRRSTTMHRARCDAGARAAEPEPTDER
jgi:hypothetical protein